MAQTRTCILCKNKYSYCPTCSRDKDKPTWYSILCSENCKNVNDIISAFYANKISIKDAKSALEKIDVASMNIMEEENKKAIEMIMAYKEPTKIESKSSVDNKKRFIK